GCPVDKPGRGLTPPRRTLAPAPDKPRGLASSPDPVAPRSGSARPPTLPPFGDAIGAPDRNVRVKAACARGLPESRRIRAGQRSTRSIGQLRPAPESANQAGSG